ncbi:MAG: M28 family metallopeptidase [Anaerolineae bacterium]
MAIPNRHVGSPGNRAATDYFADTIAAFGFDVEQPAFDCIDWEHGDVSLQAGGEPFAAQVSPYSLACRVTAPLAEASTLAALESAEVAGKILLISGDLAREQLIPKSFPFYIPVTYPGLAELLEQKQPAAIVAATAQNPELAGAWYPFPLIEDGDFNIPSVFMTDVEGARLSRYRDTDISLSFESRRIPARGCNVIARKGADLSARRVFCAHIDTKKGTPGALDNATGVATLLALAELLADYAGDRAVEIVAFNGEDYYAASGQVQYIGQNRDRFNTIHLAVNMDLAGDAGSDTVYSLYGCSEAMTAELHQLFAARHGLAEGIAWYQSDHSVFIQNGVPAVALTSADFMALSTTVTHTEKDTLALVDARKLAVIARALKDVALALS